MTFNSLKDLCKRDVILHLNYKTIPEGVKGDLVELVSAMRSCFLDLENHRLTKLIGFS